MKLFCVCIMSKEITKKSNVNFVTAQITGASVTARLFSVALIHMGTWFQYAVRQAGCNGDFDTNNKCALG